MRYNPRILWGLLVIAVAMWGVPVYAAGKTAPQTDDSVTSQSSVEVPSPMQVIEQLAEQVVVEAANRNWDVVDQKVSEIRTDWLDFEPVDAASAEPGRMQRMEYALKQLANVSRQRKRLVTVLAANEVSSTAMEVYSLYNPQLPGSVERLDEQQRRIVLDAALGQFNDAALELQGANRIWYFFKRALTYRGGGDLAQDLQAKLDLEQEFIHSKNRTDLLATAQQALVSLYQVADLLS